MHRTVSIAAAAAALLLVAGAAGAQDCRTWLPDLAGCDRSGRFEGFEKPMVQPYLFEDPFNVTGVYPYYVWHEFPDGSALQGGDLHVVALQLRLALTDRLGLIATKDGYGWLRPDNPILDDDQGWFNLGLGLKYVLAQDRDAGWAVSGILRFEAPSGTHDLFQGYGDGMVLPSLAAAGTLGPVRLQGDFGAEVPFDTDQQSTSLFYHLYAGVPVTKYFVPFAQFSGISWIDDGNGGFPVRIAGGGSLPLSTAQAALGTGSFEGADVANLGSASIDGKSLLTWAVGVHVPITAHVTFSAAYERAFGGGYKGIFEQRVTSAVAIEF
jgi:hypothetical protein